MASLEELREERLKKRQILEEKGFDTYPAKSTRTHTIFDFNIAFDTLAESKEVVTIAGRVMSQRGQGALAFADMFDGTGKTQLFLKSDEMDSDIYTLWNDTTDVGDFVEATGIAYLTKRGEKALFVSDWKMLTKSLLPLPEKWHGITDPDERYRKRYLDILTDPELQDLFYKKSQFWEVTRNFMKEAGFLEVETPTIEVTTGGAEANPFKTRHNDFDIDVFMRISVGELWQKRLMAAGFAKTFEIGRVYRNEGSSPDHLQEFTNMEFYWAYADYEMGMDIVERLYKKIAVDVFGKTEFTTRGHTFDLNDTWKKIDYVEEIEKQTGINVLDASDADMKAKLDELGVKYTGENRERLTDTLWKYCRKSISGPAFLVRVPKLVSPLAKACTDDPRVTERFQVLLAGSEVGNGFSELNDPIDQRARFELQQSLIEAGDEEAMMPEWEFVEMLEHGMPPTCGFGFGERLFAFLVDKPLRETQLFPLLKPKNE
ncbi:MAG: lysine--tRNA ligase [Candidatus Pacebacteria bacterium]|nr:lysine--tRNA ligase [Candidatus Paceibacterota bacterium]